MKKNTLYCFFTTMFFLFFLLIHTWFKLGAISIRNSKSFTPNDLMLFDVTSISKNGRVMLQFSS